jgi:hypothetical protein
MAIHYPPAFINAYMQAQITSFWETGDVLIPDDPATIANEQVLFSGNPTIPFFPTLPTSLDDLYTQFPQADGMFAVYDRMFKMRKTPFPHIKSEQLLYYFFKMEGDPVKLIETTQAIQDLLDREDESAQELNAWAAAKQASTNPLRDEAGNIRPLPFFHKIRIYQLEETRDLIDFGTARTYAGNKIIIDYDWHKS